MRYLVAFTEAQIGALRSLASITIESNEGIDADERRHLAKLAEAIDAIDLARELPLDSRDVHAYAYAAGDLLDDPDGLASLRQALGRRGGNPFRVRTALRRAFAPLRKETTK